MISELLILFSLSYKNIDSKKSNNSSPDNLRLLHCLLNKRQFSIFTSEKEITQ